MGHLFPELPRCPSHRVGDLVMFDHVAPVAATALGAEQFLQPFVAQHQHGVGIEDQLRLLGIDAALLQLLRLQQMQKVLLAVALDALLRVGRTKQLPFLGAAVAAGRLCCAHPKEDPLSPYGPRAFGQPQASGLIILGMTPQH